MRQEDDADQIEKVCYESHCVCMRLYGYRLVLLQLV
jgi:hypothetical protein